MSMPDDLLLRPRFQKALPCAAETILSRLATLEEPPFRVKRMDDHVFIRFREEESHFWSPQLQLEILDNEDGGCRVYGLFGPNPTLWTFFMFLHFGVATLFVIFGIWAYSSASLGRPYGVLIGAMAGMVVFWFVLYFFGRAGKAKGKPQMNALFSFFNNCIGREFAGGEKPSELTSHGLGR